MRQGQLCWPTAATEQHNGNWLSDRAPAWSTPGPPCRRPTPEWPAGAMGCDQTVETISRRWRAGLDGTRLCPLLPDGAQWRRAWRWRIMAPQAVKQMTTASLPPDTRFAGVVGGFMGPRWGTGWGLGFADRTDPSSPSPGRIGSFTWGGVWDTGFWIDPAEKLAVVQMIQIEPADDNGRYRRALQNLTYEALRTTS